MAYHPGAGPQVLLVEPSAEIRRLIRLVLERAGCRVTEASGPEAERLAASECFQVILTNRPARFLGAPAKLLYISGFPDRQIAAQCDAMLEKPFQPDELLAAIHSLINF